LLLVASWHIAYGTFPLSTMSAIFDFASLISVLLLLICTCTYLRELRPAIFDGGKVRINVLRTARTKQLRHCTLNIQHVLME
jgi:hypothetical protein